MRLGSAVALILLLLIPASSPATDARSGARLLASVRWDVNARWFGGFSAIDLAPGGRDFMALTDHGSLVSGRFDRTGTRLTGINIQHRYQLKDTKGAPLRGRYADAEGLVLRKGGGFCVSFEFTSDTWCLDSPHSRPKIVPAHPNFLKLHRNSTLEALAVDARGRLVTIPENAPSADSPFPVYRLENGKWRVLFTVPRDGGFLPVGADFGPDGRLYLLEREMAMLGFRSRVRSWDVSDDRADDPRTDLETVYLMHGNLEGLSVWRDGSGHIRMTMVSDNNFLDLMRTEIVEYVLPALASDRATN